MLDKVDFNGLQDRGGPHYDVHFRMEHSYLTAVAGSDEKGACIGSILGPLHGHYHNYPVDWPGKRTEPGNSPHRPASSLAWATSRLLKFVDHTGRRLTEFHISGKP